MEKISSGVYNDSSLCIRSLLIFHIYPRNEKKYKKGIKRNSF